MRAKIMFLGLLGVAACKARDAQAPAATSNAPVNIVAPADNGGKAQAYKDGVADIASIKAALGTINPAYSCDRLAVAVRAVEHDADENYQRMVADAETVCGFLAPLGWAETRLTNIEAMKQGAPPKQLAEECGGVRAMLNRVHAKFRTSPRAKTVSDRFKNVCRGRGDHDD